MFIPLQRAANRHLANIPGFQTRRHLVVFESDDWGSIRTSGPKAYRACLQAGYPTERSMFERYDSLAGPDDLEALYEVLQTFRDRNGRHPMMTVNTVVANPDFEKIAETRFREYRYEPFTATLARYYPAYDVLRIWRQGISEGLFRPQFHGREHFNIPRWLDLLRSKNQDALFAFRFGMVGLTPKANPPRSNPLMAALVPAGPEQLAFERNSLAEGLDLFERTFGYRSETFIAPCYTWPCEVEPFLSERGVRLLQGTFFQQAPASDGRRRQIRHYPGQRNLSGQYYTIRNCHFEPSKSMCHREDSVARCLREMRTAFFWHKPAIVSTHRFNFVGLLDERNRTTNLQLFRRLLTEILRRWPDTEFCSSDELLPLLEGSC